MTDAQPCPACGADSDGCYCPGVPLTAPGRPERPVRPARALLHPHTSAQLHESGTAAVRARAYAALDAAYPDAVYDQGRAYIAFWRLIAPPHPAAFTTDAAGRLTLRTEVAR